MSKKGNKDKYPNNRYKPWDDRARHDVIHYSVRRKECT